MIYAKKKHETSLTLTCAAESTEEARKCDGFTWESRKNHICCKHCSWLTGMCMKYPEDHVKPVKGVK